MAGAAGVGGGHTCPRPAPCPLGPSAAPQASPLPASPGPDWRMGQDVGRALPLGETLQARPEETRALAGEAGSVGG